MQFRLPAAIALLCTFLLTLIGVQAQQSTTGIIKGQIKTTDGTPAAMVTVTLKGTKKSALTDDEGTFTLRNVTPGTYELELTLMGYQSVTQSVTVEANKTATVTAQMNLSEKQMQEVIVTAGKNKYNTNKLSSSLRLNESLNEVPQNIQVVTGANLADQQIISMSDGLIRNVSGAIRLEHWGDLYTNITMRGSQIQAFRNGMNVVNSYWGPLTEDMSMVDHIEFVKGPAGFMLANGDPAGLYNVVTKKPTGQTKGEASFTMGSFDLYRATLDLDGKLSKDGRLLYRLNLAAQNKKSHRPNEFNDRYTIAPVISYQLDDQTKLTFEYTLQLAKMSDLGSYYSYSPVGYGVLPIDATTLPVGIEPTNITDHSAYLNLQHQLSNNWKVTAQLAYFNYKQVGSSMWPSKIFQDGTMIRNVGPWDAKAPMTLGQVFLNGNVTTGKIQHRIMGGVDVGTKEYYADYIRSYALDTEDDPFDPANPNLGTPSNGYPVIERTQPIEQYAASGYGVIKQRYSGVYVQDELGFFDNTVRLTLAGRYTKVTQNLYNNVYSADHVTPRFGLSVSIDRNTSVYGLFDQAFTPQSGILRNGGEIKPITGSNTEFGIKKDWANGQWTSTLSVYRIIKNNELTSDPSNSGPNENFSVVLGQKRAEGVEFDVRGIVVRGLTVTANYAYTNSKVTKVTEGVTGIKVGDVLPGFAKHTANAWISYEQKTGVLKGTGVSGGFTYQADRATSNWSDGDTRYNLPNYFRLDGGVFYERNKIRFTLNMFNILNKYLYSGGYYQFAYGDGPTDYHNVYYWQTEPPRNLRLSVAYKF